MSTFTISFGIVAVVVFYCRHEAVCSHRYAEPYNEISGRHAASLPRLEAEGALHAHGQGCHDLAESREEAIEGCLSLEAKGLFAEKETLLSFCRDKEFVHILIIIIIFYVIYLRLLLLLLLSLFLFISYHLWEQTINPLGRLYHFLRFAERLWERPRPMESVISGCMPIAHHAATPTAITIVQRA